MNKEVVKMTIQELGQDKKGLVKNSMKIGGVVLAGKVVKDIGNSMYNGVKKNGKKVKENRCKLKNNKKKIKNSKEYLGKIKEEEARTKQEKQAKAKRIRQVKKDISCLEEKTKISRKNILKHSSLAMIEIVALPVTLGLTGVAGCKILEIERQSCREASDEIESIYRGIEYNMEDEYEL